MALSRRLAPVLAVAVLLLTGCAAGPEAVGPSGVDGLEIPTPTPDPRDFVNVVDNPWLPLQPGAEWVYESTGAEPETITVTVTDETREVAGVTTTVVRTQVAGGGLELGEESEEWYAQDSAGNVWLFGADGPASWEAGLAGAQAGLAMPATPRVGDGYQRQSAPGVAEGRAEVLELDAALRLDTASYDALLVIEETTPLRTGLVERTYYARGTGLVFEETVSGGFDDVELVSFTPGD